VYIILERLALLLLSLCSHGAGTSRGRLVEPLQSFLLGFLSDEISFGRFVCEVLNNQQDATLPPDCLAKR
jgi:hypothetical protein